MRVLNVPSCAAGVPIFKTLPAASLSQLGETMRHGRYEKGEVVAAAGAMLDSLLVVAKGQLKLVHTSASGREQVVRTLGTGDFIGELALFTPVTLDGDLIAVEDSAVCIVPRAAVQEIMLAHPKASLALVEALARRLAHAESLIADLGLHDVGQRLASALLRMIEEQKQGKQSVAVGSKGDERFGETIVQVPAPWAEMAVRLGTTPESLSRRLKAMGDQGILRQAKGRTVHILDMDRLKKLAHS